MTFAPTLDDLRALSVDELEAHWVGAPAPTLPDGVYRGHHLARIDNAGSRRPHWRWSQRVAFEWAPFGVDFDRRLWFFFTTRLALGRFEPRVGPSRWRHTDAVGLHYDPSRLPAPIRGVLYDEVKPLTERLLLGIGGIRAGRDEGDHFFFALERVGW
jgi:hypothetical protein